MIRTTFERLPMSKYRWLLLAAVAIFFTSSLARSARADGVLVPASALSESARSSLAQEIAQARTKNTAAFAAVRKVDGYTAAAAARTRHNKPTAVRDFRRLGPAALFPLIELAAFDAKRGSLTDEEWRTFGDGILQALAFLRDTRAEPVLEAVFLSAKEPSWIENAALGLGMLGGEHERELLLASLAPGNPRRAAAISGLAFCRNIEVAQRLAPLLADPDPLVASRAARSLGYVGSSWALAADKTLSPADRDEIGAFAASALLTAYTGQGPTVRSVMYRATLMVEHPSAGAAISRAKRSASPDVKRELERLALRLEANRARARP